MLALCLPAKAVTVDVTHPLEMYFNGADIPPGGYPIQLARITVTFGANPLNPGETINHQIFDADHVLLDSHSLTVSSTWNSFMLGAEFFPTPTNSPYLSAVFSTTGSGSFDIVSATANINDVDYIVVGSFNAPSAVPGPVVGAGIPGLMALGLFGLNYYRRRRNNGGLPA